MMTSYDVECPDPNQDILRARYTVNTYLLVTGVLEVSFLKQTQIVCSQTGTSKDPPKIPHTPKLQISMKMLSFCL